ncbi:TPM domain-containing protein [Zhouia sp. PK063]|uniref:TPM domain-containing protein n=1 Tax=Zhouia sp. PK063 TaxID=3373602 RepID=UPI0037BA7302
MPESKSFLTQKDENEIIEAIKLAEKNTSGEIRVHIEKTSKKDAFDRAMEVFYGLEMNNTKQSNGVLIYVAIDDRNFVIYGDKGINDVVEDDFWNSTKEVILNQFKKSNFKQGLIDGILMAGEQLKKHFPWDTNDTNELSDEISKG